MKWSSLPFISLYESISNHQINDDLFNELVPDLQNLLLQEQFPKNAKHRTELESHEINLDGESIYKINNDFLYAIVAVSDELNLDEKAVAELMLTGTDDYTKTSISLSNLGKVQYFLRRQYVLQIVNYVTNCSQKDDPYYQKIVQGDVLFQNTLSSFKFIHQQLENVKQQVTKALILDTYDDLTQQDVKFKRDFLLRDYDILSQILYGIVTSCLTSNNGKRWLLQLIDVLTVFDSDDFFIVYYLPSIFHILANLDALNDDTVIQLHTEFTDELKRTATIYAKPAKVSIIFIFLTFFISWCKSEPHKRAKKFDFKTQVDDPISLTVELGAIEQLLVFAADTSHATKHMNSQLFYDTRSLLQRHIPKLIPKQLFDVEVNNRNATQNLNSKQARPGSKYHIFTQVFLSEQTEKTLLLTFNDVLQAIINDCAFLLTTLKDAEEDSLLSGENLTLDDMSIKADIERFFLTIYYFYFMRPNLSKIFWMDNESNAYGFIEWAAKCNDNLMKSCFYMMMSSISYGSENSINALHYFGDHNERLSWQAMAGLIVEYKRKMESFLDAQHRQHLQTSSTEIEYTVATLQEGLNEESLILLSSMLTLISSVSEATKDEMKINLFEIFDEPVFSFAELDTDLRGACLKTLSDLLPEKWLMRTKVWSQLDELFFKAPSFSSKAVSYAKYISQKCYDSRGVIGFLKLFENLLQHRSELISLDSTPVPFSLGRGYRRYGVWPYYDFIFNEVLISAHNNCQSEDNIEILLLILRIVNQSIDLFDFDTIYNSLCSGIDLDKVIKDGSFDVYAKENPASAVFNYLFSEKIYKILFSIIEIGVDNVVVDKINGSKQLQLLGLALNITNKVLDFQDTYIEELCPLIKGNKNPEFYLPKDFGLHGLRSFHDAIFFNMIVIAHLGLYLSLDDHNIVSDSLRILQKISAKCSQKGISNTSDNKLLIILDSVDESARIKDSFIYQLERSVGSIETLKIKFQLLEFLTSNLSYTDQNPTVAHFLLGFQISNLVTAGSELATFINSEKSLFHSVVQLLQSSLMTVGNEMIDYAPMRLTTDCLQILLKLARNPLTAAVVYEHLRYTNLFQALISLDPDINKYTLWSGKVADFSSDSATYDFITSESIGALLAYLDYKNTLIQFLSLFLHRTSHMGTNSQMSQYVNGLITKSMYSAKIFTFLDALSYDALPNEHIKSEELNYLKNLPLDFDLVSLSNSCQGNIYEFKSLRSLINLIKLSIQSDSITIKDISATNVFNAEFQRETQLVEDIISLHLSRKKFAELQLLLLHSWVQLVQMIVNDGQLEMEKRSDLILEVFGSIIPRINEYMENNISFSAELVSLAVFLFDIYNRDVIPSNCHRKLDTRLYSLFKVCLTGIRTPHSNLTTRSDLYVLANNYVVRALKDPKAAKSLVQDMRMFNDGLIDTICNDVIHSEGQTRITGILLLDSFYQLASYNKENFILTALTKDAKLYQLIKTLNFVDKFHRNYSGSSAVDDILYELTNYKATMLFLVRIAKSRNGASALIQNKVFQVLNYMNVFDQDVEHVMEPSVVSFSNTVLLPYYYRRNPNDSRASQDGTVHVISVYELVVPIFQLACAVLVSMGSSNSTVIQSVKKLLSNFRKLVFYTLKTDDFGAANPSTSGTDAHHQGFLEMTKLSTILCSLTGYHGQEIATSS